MKETIEEFKHRINKYNLLHGLIPGDTDFIEESEYNLVKSDSYNKLRTTMINKEDEEHCLYCGKYEKGHPDNTEYICSNCVMGLLDIPLKEKELLHKEATKLKITKSAEALQIFSHIGEKNGKPKRRRNKRKRPVR